MPHPLNTNKQFMIGNFILAFAVIAIVVIFVFLSLHMQRSSSQPTRFAETYSLELDSTFALDSVSIYVNDSLLLSTRPTDSISGLTFARFAQESTLMLVDEATQATFIQTLEEDGGTYRLSKAAGEVQLLRLHP